MKKAETTQRSVRATHVQAVDEACDRRLFFRLTTLPPAGQVKGYPPRSLLISPGSFELHGGCISYLTVGAWQWGRRGGIKHPGVTLRVSGCRRCTVLVAIHRGKRNSTKDQFAQKHSAQELCESRGDRPAGAPRA